MMCARTNPKPGIRLASSVWIALTLTIAASVLTGCAPKTQAASNVPPSSEGFLGTATPTETISKSATIAIPTTVSTAVPATASSDVIWPLPSSDSASASLPYWIYSPELTTLEWRIDFADVVARVRLLSESVQVHRLEGEHHEKGVIPFYVRSIEFEFEVLEYLKGSGSNIIWGVVPAFGSGFTEEEARDQSQPDLLAIRDKYFYSRWDDRDAIVFLRRSGAGILFHSKMYPIDTIFQEPDRYWLGDLNRHYETYSIASPHNKSWLPSAQPSGASGTSGVEQQFLLDAPGGYAAGGSSDGASGASESSAPKISLSSLKARIAQTIGTPTPAPTPELTSEPTPTSEPATTATPEPTNTPEPTATPTDDASDGL